MSSSDRRAFLTCLALLPLAGCGFQPAYGTGGAAEGLRGRVFVAAPSNRSEYELVARLEERLGRAEAPAFDLAYTLKTQEEGLSVTGAQETTRYNVLGTLDFRLTERATGTVSASGRLNSFTGYSATSNSVATLTGKQDAYDRLMVILADQLVTRLIASVAGRGG